MSRPVEFITFDQMKGAIGSLLFLWANIESELARAARMISVEDEARPAHGISRSIKAWQLAVARDHRPLHERLCHRVVTLLADALVVRNLVCHGLRGISSASPHHEAYITVELGGDRRVLGWGEMQEMLTWMSRTPDLIYDLTSAAIDEDVRRADERLLAWEGFPRLK